MPRYFPVLIIAALLLSCTTPSPNATPEDPVHDRLTHYLDTLERVGFMGSVLVAKDGEVLIARGCGMRDAEKGARNTAATVFDIGSITKQFTAAAILVLEERGLLNVSDPLVKYFPTLPADKQGITIHFLLRHSSGLPGGIGGDYEPIGREEFLQQLFIEPLESPPGKHFGYSNAGYSLLAMIIEDVSGMSYERFLQETLFAPAGLRATGYSLPRFHPDSVAVGYDGDEMPWGRPTEKAWDGDAPYWHLKGNGGILSTVEDLYAWDQALTTDAVLSATARTKLFAPELRPEEDPHHYYAYGWDVHRTPRGTRVIGHNGSNRIFYADFVRYVDEGLTVIHCSNRASRVFRGLTHDLTMLVLDSTHVPVIPIAESKANRDLSRHVIAIAKERGHEEALRAFGQRPPGTQVLEHLLNDAGYELLGNDDHQKAVEVFAVNTKLFPASANAFDSLGEACWHAGRTKEALAHYRRSLELDPQNGNAEEAIAALLAGRAPFE